MKVKKFAVLLIAVAMIFCMTACSKKCANGCGRPANPNCLAGMCDTCCVYWSGINGCRTSKYH